MIKSSHYVPLDDKKVIEPTVITSTERSNQRSVTSSTGSHQASELEQAVRDKQLDAELERLKAEAQAEAIQILERARGEAEQLRQLAEAEIEAWRRERQQAFEEELASAAEQMKQQAYTEGLHNGEHAAKEEWAERISSATKVLDEAHAAKREVIAEAEPFLLELSVQIAESIIGRQLTLEPEWTIDLIRSVLARERRKGLITVCVSPEQYPIIRAARDELKAAVDSQAELQIIPDGSVTGYGCVVRSDFGSLDARIDSQLTEIKQALFQVLAAEQGET